MNGILSSSECCGHMNIATEILKRFEENAARDSLLQFLKTLDETKFSMLLEEAWRIREENFEPVLNCFYPGNKFPAISITGAQCALNCQHCNKHYLTLMEHAETPAKLWSICKKFNAEGKIGVLLSGGYNEEAMLPFRNFLPVIRKIKANTNLILNVHTGLIDRELAQQLGEAGVDIVSFDLVGDASTIKEIYRLKKTPEDYLKSMHFLREAGIPHIVPHICIGLRGGLLSGEIHALKLLKDFDLSLIVLLGLIPTIDTPLQNVKPNTRNIALIIATTRILFPTTPISLGCMRPGKSLRPIIDQYAIQAGVNRIEIPTHKALEFATTKGLQIQKYDSCCAVPLELL